MFSIYGLSGQVFNGRLEAMDSVRRLSRARAVQPVVEDGDEPGVDAVALHSRQEAIRSYREVLHRDFERGPLYHAEQVMQGPVITVATTDPVTHAWQVLRDNGIYQAPVLDAQGSLVGIVSERDLLTAIDIDGERVIETLHRWVRDVMTTPVVAASPLTDIRRIAAAMLEHGVDGVPVVDDNGRLLGFVSRSDVLRAVVTDPPLSLWR